MIALSGGAALGLAHIGVLRNFEGHHIPIDKLGGTSIGGLVGGLYAVGMDSSQIEALAQQADWNALLKPSPPFRFPFAMLPRPKVSSRRLKLGGQCRLLRMTALGCFHPSG